MIATLGRHAELAVVDIKSAFRLLRIHPGDCDLLGFRIEKKYYIDKCLPMGWAVSSNIFEKFATFLHWLVEKKSGFSTLDHFLDDFLFAGKAQSNNCKVPRDCFLETTAELGVPIAKEKSKGPVTVLTFLGLEIDTNELAVRIPEEKLKLLIRDLKFYLSQNKITLKKFTFCGWFIKFLLKSHS